MLFIFIFGLNFFISCHIRAEVDWDIRAANHVSFCFIIINTVPYINSENL